MRKREIILSIAGSDSGAGAGIQADIKSAAACGGYCATAITALTSQNTAGVQAIDIIPAKTVETQIDSVLTDLYVKAVKTGMLPSKAIVDIVARKIEEYDIPYLVLDPVMVSTSGHTLVEPDVANHIIARLFPLTTLVTPNIPEAEFISRHSIHSPKDFDKIAEIFKDKGCKALLLKAGHLDTGTLTDHLYDFQTDTLTRYSFPKLNTPNTHGTGCSLSSAIATYLTAGFPIPEAVAKAEEFLHKAIENGINYKYGSGHGPINHFYKLTE